VGGFQVSRSVGLLFSITCLKGVCMGLYSHSNRGPITTEDNRVHGCQTIHGCRACITNEDSLRKSESMNKRTTIGGPRLQLFTHVCVLLYSITIEDNPTKEIQRRQWCPHESVLCWKWSSVVYKNMYKFYGSVLQYTDNRKWFVLGGYVKHDCVCGRGRSGWIHTSKVLL